MSLPRDNKPKPPPLLAPRDAVRLMAALSMMVFLLWAMTRTGDPRTWAWVENMNRKPADDSASAAKESPASVQATVSITQQAYITQVVGMLGLMPDPCVLPIRVGPMISTVSGYEHLTWPELPAAPTATRQTVQHAPEPSAEILKEAVDYKGFLTEDPDEISYANARRKLDADARYHLLDTAIRAELADLAKDARSDVRHSALLRKPKEYRGQVIHVQGQLRWLRTFELSRDSIPGLKFVYEGLITAGPDAYWVLFKDLPPGLPPKTEWNNLYIHDVRLNGYFLKVLLTKDDKTNRTFEFPLLIGRALEMPPPVEGNSFLSGFWTLAIIAGCAAFVLGLIFWLHTLGERRYAARLAAVRAKAKLAAPEGTSEAEAVPTETSGNRLDSPNPKNGWPNPSEN